MNIYTTNTLPAAALSFPHLLSDFHRLPPSQDTIPPDAGKVPSLRLMVGGSAFHS